MNTNLDIQLSEQAFSSLSAEALAAGRSPAELAASVVESIYAGNQPDACDPQAARSQFEKCFGSVDLGRPVGLSNEVIDADLVGEYLNAHGPT